MTKFRAILLAIVAFVIGMALCVALFAVLDVDFAYLIAPLIGVAAGAFGAYRVALEDEDRQAS